MRKVFLSLDIEADGPSPALNNMRSIGIVAFDQTGKEIWRLQRNLKPLKNHTEEKKCMEEFWNVRPELWKFVNSHAIEPLTLIEELEIILTENPNVTWICYPAAYDWQWLNYYYCLLKSRRAPDVGHTARCIRTMLHVYCQQNNIADQAELMKELTDGLELTHNPENDARYQGRLYFNLCERLKIVP